MLERNLLKRKREDKSFGDSLSDLEDGSNIDVDHALQVIENSIHPG